MKVQGMLDEGLCQPWDVKWQSFGPVPNTVAPLREDPGIDDLKAIPSKLTVDGQDYQPVSCRSTGGQVDLRSLFGTCPGIPIAFLFARVSSPSRRKVRIFFSADWFTRWYVNGVPVGDTAGGNVVASDDIHFNNFAVILERGDNLIMVKVGGGGGGWNLHMGVSHRVSDEKVGALCAIPRGTRRLGAPTRDYSRTGLRIEYRGHIVPGLERRLEEPLMRAAGIQARWIQVVDHRGRPLYPSLHLPGSQTANAASKKRLQTWIRAIQDQGVPVMSWYPMCYSAEAVRVHPDWASRPFPGDRQKCNDEAAAHGCINSPYGEALIAFAIEAIGELGLDGFWFDGSHFSPFQMERCACDSCRRKFKNDTGHEFPAKSDWSDASFRHWVKWRYRTFMEYWGRLAGGIHRAHPHARVAINHLHRPDGGTSCWLMGAPLGPTGIADTIGGTEGSSLWRTSAFITRLTRAYGYNEVENWMGLHLLHTVLKGDPTVYLHHALDCMTAGGMPSFGTDDSAERNRRAYEALAAIINPRAPWVGGESVPYVALHVSDQAETFHFSRLTRQRDHSHFPHGYWRSILGWDHLLTETQCLTDVIFDAHLKSRSLSRYPIVIMPLSVALSDADLAALEDYVAGGGVLVAGPGFGACDEWGEPADPARVRKLLGIQATPPPEMDHQTTIPDGMAIRPLGRGNVIHLQGDVGGRFQASRSRILARATADLLRKLAPPVLRVTDDPNIHVGLFRRKGELILHVQNGIGYSETLKSAASPLLRPPSLRRSVHLDIEAYPVRKVELVAGECGKQPVVHPGKNGTTIILPELAWGAVLKLEI